MAPAPDPFEALLPLACDWAAEQERAILRDGIGLTPSQLEDAIRLGVTEPERVRLLEVEQIPRPTHPALRAAAEATGFLSPETVGLTLRHGIFVRSDHRGDRRLIAHELVHTAQYEKLGGIEPFLRRYLLECMTIGYPAAPLEQEAIARSAELCS